MERKLKKTKKLAASLFSPKNIKALWKLRESQTDEEQKVRSEKVKQIREFSQALGEPPGLSITERWKLRKQRWIEKQNKALAKKEALGQKAIRKQQ